MFILLKMTDVQDIQSLLQDEKFDVANTELLDSQWEYINDLNNNSYTGGSINFDTMALRDKWHTLHDAFLAIPLKFTYSKLSAATTALGTTATEAITFRRSVADLVYGVTVSSGSGSTIVSEQNNTIINNLRLLFETSYDEWQENAASLVFHKDSVDPELGTMPYGTAVAFPTDATNKGLMARTSYFREITTNAPTAPADGSGVFQTVAHIPLAVICDLFKQMKFPLINLRLLITIQVNMYSNKSYHQPIVTNIPVVTSGGRTLGDLEISAAPYADTIGGSLSSCRLYYRVLKFHPSLNVALAQRLASGFSKEVMFRLADQYTYNAEPAGPINRLVTPSVIHPTRLFLMAPVNNSFTDLRVLPTYSGAFSNANILVNNKRYYNNDLMTSKDFYDILKQQMPENPLVSYHDFLNGYRVHVFDLSRLQDRIAQPNSAVSLQVNARRDAGGNRDHVFIVERLQKVTFHMSSGDSNVVIGL